MPARSIKKPVTDAANEKRAETVDMAKKETAYTIEKLREHCMQLFKVTTSTFDGAMYGTKAEKMTIGEAKATINKWLGRSEK